MRTAAARVNSPIDSYGSIRGTVGERFAVFVQGRVETSGPGLDLCREFL